MQTPSQQSPSQVLPNARQQTMMTLSHSQKPRRSLQTQVLTNGRQMETPRGGAPLGQYHGRRVIAPRHVRPMLDIYMNCPCKSGIVSPKMAGSNNEVLSIIIIAVQGKQMQEKQTKRSMPLQLWLSQKRRRKMMQEAAIASPSC